MFLRLFLILICLSTLVQATDVCWGQASEQAVDENSTLKPRNKKTKAKKPKKDTTPKYSSFEEAQRAGYELKNSGKLAASRDAYEAALGFESRQRDKCDVYRVLITIYPELNDWDSTFKATEYIIENAPYPAFASLSLSSVLALASRKKKVEQLFSRYEAKLEANPKDRTSLIILEDAVYQFESDLPRRAEYLRRLIELDIEEGKKPDTDLRIDLAFTLKLSHKEVESAEMYEAISQSEKDCRSYCLAEAADSWQRAGKAEKSLAAATEASRLGPDVRATKSLYSWHRLLADLFLKHLAKEPAKKHYTAALEHASIDPYREQCRERIKLVDALKD